MATNLYTKPADAAPDPVTNLCPDSKASIGASSRLRILYSSKSPETIICASGAPSLSRSALANFDPAARSPESIRIPFKLAFEAFTALTMPASISYVSTRKIESSPKYLAWFSKASISDWNESVKACEAVPAVGIPQRLPASRLDVTLTPPI